MIRERIGPAASLDFIITKITDDITVSIGRWVVLDNVVAIILPVTFIKWPKAMAQAVHDRLNEGLIRMIIKHRLKAVDVKGSLNTDKMMQLAKSRLNLGTVDEVRWWRCKR